jgi:hypothetical protein
MIEQVGSVEVLDSGDVLVKLQSGGQSSYSYVYRAARGVYWEGSLGGFRSDDRKEWSVTKWFVHIRDICRDELGVKLKLSVDAKWVNVPEDDKRKILELADKA